MCGVPESLLSERGTDLLSYLMTNVCSLLGITTAYHLQCDGLTERFNRTLKTMIRKHGDDYGKQWDKYLHGMPDCLSKHPTCHDEVIAEKPSYLLYGRDCCYPIEAAFLPANEVEGADLTDYRQELTEILSQSRKSRSITKNTIIIIR